MKILLYSFSAHPALGGVETITHTLATNLIRNGVECTVVTETPGASELSTEYKVIRRPSWRQRLKLARSHDLIHSNGASMRMFLFSKITGKPFIWTHNGYQLSCIDGLGFKNGEFTPRTPFASVAYYIQHGGFFFAVKEGLKLCLRRCVGDWVDLNIAATHWIAKKQPLRNQVVAYTPYALDDFKKAAQEETKLIDYQFIYIGRLVSEKGIVTLLKAFELLVRNARHKEAKLLIVGDGPDLDCLKNMAIKLNINKRCFFERAKVGKSLMDVIAKSKIGIVPSLYEEPMGGVTLELLASGKNVIVSQYGGHAECAGQAALFFENGNVEALHGQMEKMLSDTKLSLEQLNLAKERIILFDEDTLTKKYIDLYKEVLK